MSSVSDCPEMQIKPSVDRMMISDFGDVYSIIFNFYRILHKDNILFINDNPTILINNRVLEL